MTTKETLKRGATMANNKQEVVRRLMDAGIEYDDAVSLRRISLTLHRWHELECGDSNDYASWAITRGAWKGRDDFHHDETGKPYLERHSHSGSKPTYTTIPDREAGAMKRLKAIMAKYPGMGYYIQGDPRGCALYILPPGSIPEGEQADAYYTRGIAVYK